MTQDQPEDQVEQCAHELTMSQDRTMIGCLNCPEVWANREAVESLVQMRLDDIANVFTNTLMQLMDNMVQQMKGEEQKIIKPPFFLGGDNGRN